MAKALFIYILFRVPKTPKSEFLGENATKNNYFLRKTKQCQKKRLSTKILVKRKKLKKVNKISDNLKIGKKWQKK